MEFLFIFLTGLTTGGLSCLAVQGGLLASVISNQKKQELETLSEKEKRRNKYLNSQQPITKIDTADWLPVILFLVGKLISHTILGFMLGWLGSFLTLSLNTKLDFQGITALFMFASAMNLLNVHPIFRYLAFQPPKWVRKMLKGNSKQASLFAPFVLGLFTIFVPCGVTQAMEVLAINSGNPLIGALTLMAFVLGTVPLFTIIGIATAKLSETWHDIFTRVASYTLIFMAIYTLNGALVVADVPFTIQKITYPVRYFFSVERFNKTKSNNKVESTVKVVDGIQQVVIQVLNQGYSPSYVKVKKDIPVQFTLNSNGTYSCALSFIFKEFGIRTMLDSTDKQSFNFTPTKVGRYRYTCSMGMYSGVLEVVE